MSSARIIVIDDEKSIRSALQMFLTDQGYDIILSDGSGDLVGLVSEKEPDVILLDMKMPEIDGMNLLKTLKDHDPELIIMMITGYADIDSAVQAMRLGAFDYVKKPFNLEELSLNIKKALETRSLKKEVGSLRQEQRRKYRLSSIIGASNVIKELRSLVLFLLIIRHNLC